MPVYCPPELKGSPEAQRWAKKAAEKISQWVGSGNPIEESHFDLLGFVKAVETGEDLRPYLDADQEKNSNSRVLITPDFSGSCNWCSETTGNFARSVFEQAAKNSIVLDYVPNMNGDILRDENPDVEPSRYDRIIYIGDEDGVESLEKLSKDNPRLKVLGLSNSCCNSIAPRIHHESSKGNLTWIYGVKGTEPQQLYDAIHLIQS